MRRSLSASGGCLCGFLHSVVIAKWSDGALFKTGLFFLGLGAGLIIASVSGDFPNWWIIGALLMAIVQIPIFIKTLRD